MSDLILKTQIEVLNENLKRMQKLQDILRNRPSERIKKIKNIIYENDGIEISAKLINDKISDIINEYKKYLRDNQEYDKVNKLNTINSELDILIHTILERLAIFQNHIETKMQDSSVSEKKNLCEIACTQFNGETNTWIDRVEDINQKIKKASDCEKENNFEQAEEIRKDIWTQYNDVLLRLNQEVFTEYVDIVRGLAMRDEELDEGICRIVDDLISQCEIAGVDRSLAILAQHEAVSMTLARIIRIGFPGWTILAVPRTLHELGHIAVSGKKMQEFIEDITQNYDEKNTISGEKIQELIKYIIENHNEKNTISVDKIHEFIKDITQNYNGKNAIKKCLEEILSDIIATYLMGPAYACAAILMHFNPVSAYEEKEGHIAHAKRAYAIIHMLNWMNDQHDEKPYSNIIEKLTLEWTSALKQAKQPEDMNENDRTLLDMWMTEISNKGVIRKGLGIYSPFTLKSWWRSQEISELIDNEKIENYKPQATDNLIQVLNAAWFSCIHNPDKLERIEEYAHHVWDNWNNWKEKTKPPTYGPASPSRRGG